MSALKNLKRKNLGVKILALFIFKMSRLFLSTNVFEKITTNVPDQIRLDPKIITEQKTMPINNKLIFSLKICASSEIESDRRGRGFLIFDSFFTNKMFHQN